MTLQPSLVVLILLAAGSRAPSGESPANGGGFRDDFSIYAEGSAGAPRWHPVRGDWKIRGGKLVQTADGEGFVITADTNVEGGFRMAARFRTVAGIPGEGILFGLRSAVGPGSCQLVRVDPEGLFYGSLDASGEFRGEGPVPALVEGGTWNSLAVIVSPGRDEYRVELNGKTVAERLPLEHRGSAIGLVSNWGEQEFDLCEVSAVKEGTTRTEGAPRVPPPVDIASSPRGQLLVLQGEAPRVSVLRADLTRAGSFGAVLDGDRPVAIEIGPAGEVYALDEESGRIDRYPAEGGPPDGDPSKIAPDARPRSIAASPPLKGPRGLAILPDGRIAVAESGAGRVAILSTSGERVAEVGKPGDGPGEHQRPSDVAVDSRGRILVADFKACRVQAFAPAGDGTYRLEARSPWMAPPGRLAVLTGDRVAVLGRFAYYETGGALRILEPSLLPRGFAGCFAAGSLSEEGGLAVETQTSTGPRRILCLSRRDGRLCRFPADFSGEADVRPRLRRADGKTLIEWTPHPGSGSKARLSYRREGDAAWREAGVESSGISFRAVIEGLDAETPNEFRFHPHHDFQELGERHNEDAALEPAWSKTYRFYGPEPQGKKRYLELSVVCAVYLAFEDAGGNGFSLARDKLGSKLEHEYGVAREFFWRNTEQRLHVRADFEVIEAPAGKVKRGWLDPSQAKRDLAPLLAARGKKLEEYDSVVAMWAEPGWRADIPDDLGAVGGGGLTSFGYSTYGFGGNASAWLFCHEYHHQIDAFFNRSGHLDYPLNHPDATVQPGRYGQHWDCNAFFLRSWGDDEWFFSRFGKVLWTDDRDGDGVPDRDARLPIDEARLGSDPAKKDTDGDGLSDLDETLVGTFGGTSPVIPDTDGDRALDGADGSPRNPAFKSAATIQKGSPGIDGKHSEGEWQWIGTVAGPDVALFARWDEANLYFAARTARPVKVFLDIDGANNGWFLEEDNASFELPADASPPAELAIPAARIPALRLEAGSRFGLAVRITYREGDGAEARERELFLADPWALAQMTLGE